MFENDKDTQNLDQFTQQLFDKLITATKITNNLPSEDDFQYYASFKPFKSEMEDFGKRLYNLTQNFLQHERPDTVIPEDMDDEADKFEDVVDFVDRLMEKVDLYTEDRADKPKTNIVIAKVSKTPPTRQGRSFDSYMVHGTNIPRPQDKFEEVIDNSDSPFVPKIKHKVNALKPLDPVTIQAHAAKESGANKQHAEPPSYPHPYEHELRSLQFTENQLAGCTETLYHSLEDTPYTWVSELDQLQQLAEKLERVTEFAIDLEHHAYRSYQGFVCLMQISTRTEDFIVDTLALRKHIHILNSSFTNPKIVKVLHGSDSDVVWLQSDFGVYIVNMFDTGQASRVLDYPSFSLAYLLKFYCNVDADKKYQLADWRIRELPAELIKYAREDTHYLLYIYDRLRNELVARSNEASNLILSVWNRSKELCLKRYEKERLNDSSHILLYQKSNLLFNPIQMRVFASVYKWRDVTARQEDESTRYVLPNNMLFTISEMMPTDVPSLIACCSPVPPFIRVYAHELVRIIAEEKEAGSKSQQQLQPQQQLPQPLLQQRPSQQLTPQLPPQPQAQQQLQSQQAHARTGVQYTRDASDPRSLFNSTTFTPIHSRESDHKDAPSPVLTTEQLYHTAGWLDSATGNPTLTPTTPRRKATATVKTSASLFPDETEANDESSDDEDSITKQTAALIRSNLAHQSPFPFTLNLAQPLSSKHNTVVIADNSSSSEDVVKDTEGASDSKDESEDENEEGGEDDEETAVATKEEAAPQQPAFTTTAPAKAAAGAPASKNVPRSMAEIYKLSNQNRKRNKEKKKLKEDVAAYPSSPVVLLEDSDGDADRESTTTRTKRQKGSHKSKDYPVAPSAALHGGGDSGEGVASPPVTGDTMEFMKEIGWLPNHDKSGGASGDVKSSTKHSSSVPMSIPIPTPAAPEHAGGLSSPPKSKQNKKRQPSPRAHHPSAPGNQQQQQQRSSAPAASGAGHQPHSIPHLPTSHPSPYPQQPQHFKPPPGTSGGFVPFDYGNTTFSATPAHAQLQNPSQAYYNPYAGMGASARGGSRPQHANPNPNTSSNNAGGGGGRLKSSGGAPQQQQPQQQQRPGAQQQRSWK